MKTSKVQRGLVAIAAGVLFFAGVATAGLVGVVTAITKRDITVSGAVYPLDGGVRVEDLAGQPITLPELRPGISVELEFDEAGHLSVIHAAVVR